MKFLKLFGGAILAISITMVSCSGEDGKDGIDGIDGINGTNGTDGKDGTDGMDGQDGTDGQDGIDGIGFEELTQYGFITLKMEGNRPGDNLAFQDSTSFKFTPVNGYYLSQYSFVDSYMVGEEQWFDFSVARFLSTPDDVYQQALMSTFMEISNIGQPTQNMVLFSYNISDYAVVGEDHKYFIVSHSYDSNSPEILDLQITEVAYDPETHHLTYSFDFTVDGTGNVTGNPLHISGTVDAIVLQQVF